MRIIYNNIKVIYSVNNKTIIIAGSGRSGTTWVQDSIAEANGLRTIFEPLHPIGVPSAREFAHKYCTTNANNHDLKLFMDQVLSGNYRSLWMNYRVRPDRFNISRVGVYVAVKNIRKLVRHYWKYQTKENNGFAIKFIRANLILPWLAYQYKIPILFITRHPCAIVASRLKLAGKDKDWSSQLGLDHYRSDPNVVRLIQEEFGVDITESFSSVEAITCVWCIENILPIRWADDAGYVVTTYEALLTQQEEWQRVISRLGLSHVPDSSLRGMPSQQVSIEMQGKEFSEEHLSKWRQVISADQMREVTAVLDRFTCTIYSVDEDRVMVV